jgi:hypothetical protein
LIQFVLRSVPYAETLWETKHTLQIFHFLVHNKIQEPMPTSKMGSIIYEHATSEKSNNLQKFYCKKLSSLLTKYAIH